MAGNFLDGGRHLLHRIDHLCGFTQLQVSTITHLPGGSVQAASRAVEAARIRYHRTHQFGELIEQVIEALAHRATGSRALVEVYPFWVAGDLCRSAEQCFAFARFGIGAHRQVDEDGTLKHHIKRMQEDLAQLPSGIKKHTSTLLLQCKEGQVMHCDGRSSHDDGQPVPVVHQKREQGEDAEVHFQHAVFLVDVQR